MTSGVRMPSKSSTAVYRGSFQFVLVGRNIVALPTNVIFGLSVSSISVTTTVRTADATLPAASSTVYVIVYTAEFDVSIRPVVVTR